MIVQKKRHSTERETVLKNAMMSKVGSLERVGEAVTFLRGRSESGSDVGNKRKPSDVAHEKHRA